MSEGSQRRRDLQAFTLFSLCLGLLKNNVFAIKKNTGCFCEASLSLSEAAVELKKVAGILHSL